MNDPKGKPKIVDVAGHKIVVAKGRGGQFFGWWVEDSRKEDLVMVPPAGERGVDPRAAANVLAALDGTKPDAEADPARQALAKEEDGFVPVGFGFVDLVGRAAGGDPADDGPPGPQGARLPLGFQDKETV